MTESENIPPETQTEAEAPGEQIASVRPPRSFLGRLGCILAAVVWGFILLLPAFLITLAVQDELGLWHGGRIPDNEGHPLLLFKLLSDPDHPENEGISVTTSTVSRATETEMCLQTHVRYFLWVSEAEPASYCDCYTRADAEAEWAYAGSTSGACGAADAGDSGED
jgi:hypothetical protein